MLIFGFLMILNSTQVAQGIMDLLRIGIITQPKLFCQRKTLK